MKAFPYEPKNKSLHFIAEIGGNHNKDFNRIKSLIRKAKKAGASAVKFQFFNGKKLWHKSMAENRKAAISGQIPFTLLKKASAFAKEQKIAFGCSIFHLEDVERVAEICDFIKVSSFDCLRKDLIKACKKTKKPLFVSTGTLNNNEMGYMLTLTGPPKLEDAVFHCYSTYPNKVKDIYLPNLEDTNPWWPWKNIGWSDHSRNPLVIYTAVAKGFTLFECHFDMDSMTGSESIHGHCWGHHELAAIIKQANIIYQMGQRDEYNFDFRADLDENKYRADPNDGMRPLKERRSI